LKHRVRNEVLHTVDEDGHIIYKTKWRKTEGKIERKLEVTGKRRRRRLRQLLDDHKEKRGYWKLKDDAVDRTVWRTGFGRGCGPVVRQTADYERLI